MKIIGAKRRPGRCGGSLLKAKVLFPAFEGFFTARTRRGGTILVPYSARGDEISAREGGRLGRHAWAGIEEIEKRGRGRVEPPCALYFRPGSGKRCGGCDYMHLSYGEQLLCKKLAVEHAVRRIPGAASAVVGETAASPNIWRYRNKVQVPFSVENGRVIAGFFSPYSHKAVDFRDCLVQPEISVKIVNFVKALAQDRKWPIYDIASGRGWLRHVFVRTNADGKAAMAFVTADFPFPDRERTVNLLTEAFPGITGIFHNVQTDRTSVVLGRDWERLWGNPFLEERLGRLKLRVVPGAFMQVNTPAAEVLYSAVQSLLIEGEHADEVMDVYSGAGSIAMWVARDFSSVTGIEENPRSVACARENAGANGIGNVRFEAGRAERLLYAELRSTSARSVAVILDPPRYGCHQAVINALAHPVVRKAVYVSCNPVSFARDAALLAGKGFRLKKVKPVDMFPQTSHIETAALFTRKGR
ncbi:MAG: 23S rRNA (uracil(1939)-C(5))-methyltransferase RlmD [bacterium]